MSTTIIYCVCGHSEGSRYARKAWKKYRRHEAVCAAPVLLGQTEETQP